MENFKEEIKSVQKWNGDILYFDPDSSPKVWTHFKKYYTTECWRELVNYNFTSLHFYIYDMGEYKDTPDKKNNALFALENRACMVHKNNNDYYKPCKRLRGDTDFNFNHKHFPEFEKILNYSTNHKEKGLALLEKCKKMHHTLLNFSLMQSMGNMQRFKGQGLQLENGRKECRDRLDTFVFKLDEYYKCKNDRWNTEILRNATKANRGSLMEHLNTFDGIYDYCKKVYFIEDRNFVNRIIGEGKAAIKSAEDVVRYMTLAIDFWNEKQKYFNYDNK